MNDSMSSYTPLGLATNASNSIIVLEYVPLDGLVRDIGLFGERNRNYNQSKEEFLFNGHDTCESGHLAQWSSG